MAINIIVNLNFACLSYNLTVSSHSDKNREVTSLDLIS